MIFSIYFSCFLFIWNNHCITFFCCPETFETLLLLWNYTGLFIVWCLGISRYIPLRRTQIPLSTSIRPSPDYSFPSLSNCDELEKKALTTLVRCKYGSVEAAVKVFNHPWIVVIVLLIFYFILIVIPYLLIFLDIMQFNAFYATSFMVL